MLHRHSHFIIIFLMSLSPSLVNALAHFGTDTWQEDRHVKEQPGTDRFGDRLPEGAIARLGTTRFRSPASAICFFPDGKKLATAGTQVRLWDLKTCKTSKVLVRSKPEQHTALAVSASGKTLAWGGFNQPIIIWDISIDQKLREIAIDAGTSPQALAFSPDGRSVAALVESTPGVGKIPAPPRLWDVATGQELDSQKPDRNGRRWVALAGCNLAHLTKDEAAQLERIAASEGFHHTTRGTDEPDCVACSPDGKHLAAQYVDRALHIWDLAPDSRFRELLVQKRVSASGHLVFSPDGTKLASSFSDSPIHVRDTTTGRMLCEFAANCGWVRSMAFSPDSKSLAWAGDAHILHFASLETGKEVHQFEGHEGSVANLAFSPDSKTLISIAGDPPIRVWDARSGKQIKTTNVPRGDLIPALSRDGKSLAQVDADHTIFIWDLGNESKVCQIKKEKHNPYQLMFSADGKSLVSIADDVYFWEAATGKELSHWSRGTLGVFALAVSTDGTILAHGIGSFPDEPKTNKIELLDAKTGKSRVQFVSPGGVSPLAFSPDGKTIASGDVRFQVQCFGGPTEEDQTLRLFNVSSGIERGTFKAPNAGITAIAFSADGKILACGDRKGMICLFDLPTHKQLARLLGHEGPIYTLVFSEAGLTLASGSVDSTALVWDLSKWVR
jgi:WD40 repeat protein